MLTFFFVGGTGVDVVGVVGDELLLEDVMPGRGPKVVDACVVGRSIDDVDDAYDDDGDKNEDGAALVEFVGKLLLLL